MVLFCLIMSIRLILSGLFDRIYRILQDQKFLFSSFRMKEEKHNPLVQKNIYS